MRFTSLFLLLALSISQAFCADEVEQLYHKLKDDFESKPHFFNDAINDQRNGVISPFITSRDKDDAVNNARPLSAVQLKKLPEAYFLEKKPFFLAMAGRERLLKAGKIKNNPLLVVVDFSRRSKERRMFIMNIQKGEVLMNPYTSHAFNSDADRDGYADAFSNVAGSSKSSVGFMSTDVTYSGNYGYSLRLKGHDTKLNSSVLARAVVIHGYGGLSPSEATYGMMAYSEGCLMISSSESGRFWGMDDRPMIDLVIEKLKPGALVFTYTDFEETEGKPLILNSDWLKASDIPKEDEEEVEPDKPVVQPPVIAKPVEPPVVIKPVEQPPVVTKPIEPPKPIGPTKPVVIPYEDAGGEEISDHLPGKILPATTMKRNAP